MTRVTKSRRLWVYKEIDLKSAHLDRPVARCLVPPMAEPCLGRRER